MNLNEPFSVRHGFAVPVAEITVLEDAPDVIRFAVPAFAEAHGLLLDTLSNGVEC